MKEAKFFFSKRQRRIKTLAKKYMCKYKASEMVGHFFVSFTFYKCSIL